MQGTEQKADTKAWHETTCWASIHLEELVI